MSQFLRTQSSKPLREAAYDFEGPDERIGPDDLEPTPYNQEVEFDFEGPDGETWQIVADGDSIQHVMTRRNGSWVAVPQELWGPYDDKLKAIARKLDRAAVARAKRAEPEPAPKRDPDEEVEESRVPAPVSNVKMQSRFLGGRLHEAKI